ncbi:MAG: hypothetical protein J5825_11705 [Lachnospiraceae bacterium]|nr:hypothetical protein [Lachnospiraceae bacterium]
MKMDTINRVIGEIDDDIIEMAEKKSKVKPHKASWVKWGSIAVALVIILSVVYIFVSVFRQRPIVNPSSPSQPDHNVVGKVSETESESDHNVVGEVSESESEPSQMTTMIVSSDFKGYTEYSEMIDDASLVVSGEVTAVRNENLKFPDGSSIPHQIYTIQVDQVYKGEMNERLLEFKMLGGTREDGVKVVCVSAPVLNVGDRIFTCLMTFSDSYAEPLNYDQGVLAMDQNGSVMWKGESIVPEKN